MGSTVLEGTAGGGKLLGVGSEIKSLEPLPVPPPRLSFALTV